jgi:DNA-binding GntR family transcriptional regulator
MSAVHALTQIDELSGSLAQRVYVSLRDAIMSMALPPGTMLRKGEICLRLGVSRSPVAEAIARLSADGLVDVVPQSGTRVSRFSLEDIREAAFIREALELAAVGKVAAERTAEQLALLNRNVRLQQLLLRDRDITGFYQADEDFHALIMDFTGFAGLAASVASVSLTLKRPRLLLLPMPGRPAEALKEHQVIAEAIREGRPVAAQKAMRLHLRQLVSRFEPLEGQHPQFFRSHQVPGS